MGDIAEAVLSAQQDRQKLNQLISDYLPFIKKQLSGLQGLSLEYDDMLSLAMLTFSGCVQQYALEKGNFLAFCSVCIRNRLLDESRRQMRHRRKVVPLFDGEDENRSPADSEASIVAYNREQERTALAQEIEAFASQIRQFGIDFEDLPRICPKQTRSRKLCAKLAGEIISTPSLYQEWMATQRIARTELSTRFHISPKTLEKHRKFIVTLVILLTGDYPYMQAFLPDTREVL